MNTVPAIMDRLVRIIFLPLRDLIAPVVSAAGRIAAATAQAAVHDNLLHRAAEVSDVTVAAGIEAAEAVVVFVVADVEEEDNLYGTGLINAPRDITAPTRRAGQARRLNGKMDS
jgi:hypothetical protein